MSDPIWLTVFTWTDNSQPTIARHADRMAAMDYAKRAVSENYDTPEGDSFDYNPRIEALHGEVDDLPEQGGTVMIDTEYAVTIVSV